MPSTSQRTVSTIPISHPLRGLSGPGTFLPSAPIINLAYSRTFSRSVIHLLLLGTIVYQFFPDGKKPIIDGIGWRLPLLGVFNAIYVNLSAAQHFIPALIALLFVNGVVTVSVFIIVTVEPFKQPL